MAENLTCNYLPSICYICQKCLRCFKLSQENLCKCQKDKISRVKKPLHGQQIYQRAYTTNQIFPKLNNFLLDINTKFGYNNNFEKNFSYTTCSACNNDLPTENSKRKVGSYNNKKENEKDNDNEIEDEGNDDKDFNNKDDDYYDKDSDVNDENYEEDNDNGDYDEETVNARGPSNTLEDKLDFQEFISEYQKHSDDNIRSSSEEIEIQTKKKKKSRSLREDDLLKEKKRRSEVIADLVEMYKCDLHSTPCFIQDGRHLQLNPSRLQLWAREIVLFDMKSSVFINKNNSATQMQNSQTSNTPTPIFIQLPNLKYNCNNIYAKFEDAFLEEEITVNAIKDLTDEQLQKLGVVKIGWQKNIKQAAQQY
ncbi:hypothetical protein GLOIN_2v193871 [Rhizophagus irregularis DAOM 181602=DAOM 197198]|nr:hypothetical protein GLOIN_2v193871 [Rhizophagus irregularis DAOM 181602=DAOM 197198]